MVDLNDPQVVQQLGKWLKLVYAIVVAAIFLCIKYLYQPKTKNDAWYCIKWSLIISLIITIAITGSLLTLHYAYIRFYQ